jgi:hypothetical protein
MRTLVPSALTPTAFGSVAPAGTGTVTIPVVAVQRNPAVVLVAVSTSWPTITEPSALMAFGLESVMPGGRLRDVGTPPFGHKPVPPVGLIKLPVMMDPVVLDATRVALVNPLGRPRTTGAAVPIQRVGATLSQPASVTFPSGLIPVTMQVLVPGGSPRFTVPPARVHRNGVLMPAMKKYPATVVPSPLTPIARELTSSKAKIGRLQAPPEQSSPVAQTV